MRRRGVSEGLALEAGFRGLLLATGDREDMAEAGDHTQRTQILRKIRCASPLFQAQPVIADGTTNFPLGYGRGTEKVGLRK